MACRTGQESPLRVDPGRAARSSSQQLDAPELAQLAQRARLRFHLTALTPEQTHGYIVHRLAIAGSHGREVFQSGCFEVIDRYTGGAPRLINSLCDAALRIAAEAGRDQVLPEDVEAAASELQLPALADRPRVVPARSGPAGRNRGGRARAAGRPSRRSPTAPLPKDTRRARASRACGS